ncbi:MAG TPA: TIGR02996 domain-containing protein [Urbifossiella sp.]|nr:TIGR02996 domain-containing protein [Urbifossiella sp.]
MTDRDALYAAVLAAPDDDTPRLVFADYLDDTGVRADGIRARFVRNQVALARAEPWSDEFDTLYRATAPVEDHYRKAWATGIDGIVIPDGNAFDRGFLGRVTCFSKRFVADAAKLFAAHPVRAVKFSAMNSTRGAATAAELAASPFLARLHTIQLSGRAVDDAYVSVVGQSPHAAGVRGLTLGDCGATAAAVGRFGSPSFLGLRELELWNVVYGTNDAKAVAKSRSLAALTALRVCHGADAADVPIRGPGAVALAESPHLRGLIELELRNQELRKKGAEAFAAAYAWPGLKQLFLRGNGIPASALPAFAANPRLASLSLLDLRGNDVTAADLGLLREAFPRLRVITDDSEHPVRLVLLPEDEP